MSYYVRQCIIYLTYCELAFIIRLMSEVFDIMSHILRRGDLMDADKYLNHSILRALSILETFEGKDVALSIAEISRAVGLHRSTVHRLVVTLESAGWLCKLQKSEKFVLGLKVLTLRENVNQPLSLVDVIRPLLDDLAKRTGETIILSMKDGMQTICVDIIESTYVLKISSRIGQGYPLYAGATGLAVLIGMDEADVREYLSKTKLESFTSATYTDPEKLYQLYLRGRNDGFIVSSGHVDSGVVGIGVPIFFKKLNKYGSISCVLPDSRASRENVENIICHVKQTLKEINRRIN